jgi:hypothetical protein
MASKVRSREWCFFSRLQPLVTYSLHTPGPIPGIISAVRCRKQELSDVMPGNANFGSPCGDEHSACTGRRGRVRFTYRALPAPGATAGLSSSAVWEQLTWLVQPFSEEALDDWQAGVLLRGIKKLNSWTWPGRGNAGFTFGVLVRVSCRPSCPHAPLLDKPAVAPGDSRLNRQPACAVAFYCGWISTVSEPALSFSSAAEWLIRR